MASSVSSTLWKTHLIQPNPSGVILRSQRTRHPLLTREFLALKTQSSFCTGERKGMEPKHDQVASKERQSITAKSHKGSGKCTQQAMNSTTKIAPPKSPTKMTLKIAPQNCPSSKISDPQNAHARSNIYIDKRKITKKAARPYPTPQRMCPTKKVSNKESVQPRKCPTKCVPYPTACEIPNEGVPKASKTKKVAMCVCVSVILYHEMVSKGNMRDGKHDGTDLIHGVQLACSCERLEQSLVCVCPSEREMQCRVVLEASLSEEPR